MVLIRWEIQKLWLENQIVRATLFVELQKNMVCDLRGWNFPLLFLVCSADLDMHRLRAVSYFSLQSCSTRNLSTRAAKPRAASREKRGSLIVIITSWFAIELDEIRTRRILREKADCKRSRICILAGRFPTTSNFIVLYLRTRGHPSGLCKSATKRHNRENRL